MMKRICLLTVFALAFTLFLGGCGSSIPTLEELAEINNTERLLKKYDNIYVYTKSETTGVENADPAFDFTEETVFVKNGDEIVTHRLSRDVSGEDVTYITDLPNAFYYVNGDDAIVYLEAGENEFVDYTLSFDTTAAGEGYIENNQIVYHTTESFEADELYDAMTFEYKLYFNKRTKLLERYEYSTFDENHTLTALTVSEVSYDVPNVESKFDKFALDMVKESDKRVDIEIIVNAGTPEEVSYPFMAMKGAEIYATVDMDWYGLYSDPEYKNEVYKLDGADVADGMKLYAKPYIE